MWLRDRQQHLKPTDSAPIHKSLSVQVNKEPLARASSGCGWRTLLSTVWYSLPFNDLIDTVKRECRICCFYDVIEQIPRERRLDLNEEGICADSEVWESCGEVIFVDPAPWTEVAAVVSRGRELG